MMIAKAKPGNEQWALWGQDILTTGLFCILICATLGTMAIHFTAPLLLQPSHEKEEEEEQPEAAAQVIVHPSTSPNKQQLAGRSVTVEKVEAATLMPHPGSLVVPRRPSGSGTAVAEDYALLADYIDTINRLAAVVKNDKGDQHEAQSLAIQVLDLQRVSVCVGGGVGWGVVPISSPRPWREGCRQAQEASSPCT